MFDVKKAAAPNHAELITTSQRHMLELGKAELSKAQALTGQNADPKLVVQACGRVLSYFHYQDPDQPKPAHAPQRVNLAYGLIGNELAEVNVLQANAQYALGDFTSALKSYKHALSGKRFDKAAQSFITARIAELSARTAPQPQVDPKIDQYRKLRDSHFFLGKTYAQLHSFPNAREEHLNASALAANPGLRLTSDHEIKRQIQKSARVLNADQKQASLDFLPTWQAELITTGKAEFKNAQALFANSQIDPQVIINACMKVIALFHYNKQAGKTKPCFALIGFELAATNAMLADCYYRLNNHAGALQHYQHAVHGMKHLTPENQAHISARIVELGGIAPKYEKYCQLRDTHVQIAKIYEQLNIPEKALHEYGKAAQCVAHIQGMGVQLQTNASNDALAQMYIQGCFQRVQKQLPGPAAADLKSQSQVVRTAPAFGATISAFSPLHATTATAAAGSGGGSAPAPSNQTGAGLRIHIPKLDFNTISTAPNTLSAAATDAAPVNANAIAPAQPPGPPGPKPSA